LLASTDWTEEEIFGPLGDDGGQAKVFGGRDTFYLRFKDGRVSDASYAIGY
jgi:hypothetical protein